MVQGRFMRSEALIDSLERYTHRSDGSWRMHPFTIAIKASHWQGATDRAWFIATRGRGAFPLAPEDDPVAKRLALMLSLLVPSSANEVEVSQLREWAGPTEGRDFMIEDQRPGVLEGVVLDLRRLAYLLDNVPADTVRMWNTTSDIGVASIGFDVKGRWRAFLAGIDAAPEDDMPVFKKPTEMNVMDFIAELDQE